MLDVSRLRREYRRGGKQGQSEQQDKKRADEFLTLHNFYSSKKFSPVRPGAYGHTDPGSSQAVKHGNASIPLFLLLHYKH
jgi:hypothetical protein